jgi:hypothetical protein
MSFDKRSQLEIDVGAALNDAEAIESFVDDFLREHASDTSTGREALRRAAWARHHAYAARIIVDRIFSSILRDELVPEYARSEITKVRKNIKLMFQNVLETMPGRHERSEKQDNLLDRISKYEHRVKTAIVSIGVRILERKVR